MTEEQNEVKTEKCNCICQSKGFRKFVVVALGTFVGVYCALALFTAIHRPPILPYPCAAGCPLMRPPIEMQYNNFNKGGDFERKIAPDRVQMGKRTPFEAPRPNQER